MGILFCSFLIFKYTSNSNFYLRFSMIASFDELNFFDVSHLSVAIADWAMKVGDVQTDGQTDRQSLYKSFHFLRYKRSVEANGRCSLTLNGVTMTLKAYSRNSFYILTER